MARNKFPEQTVERILKSAGRLFMEKGYEHTTVQDIIEDLGDLTKGAIYHHFKGKEEMMIETCRRHFAAQNQFLSKIRDNSELTGLKKIQLLIKTSVLDPAQTELYMAAPNLQDSPRMLVLMMQEAIENTAVNFIQPIFEEGVRDGSIKTEFPEELSQVFMLLCNIWANPLIFKMDQKTLFKRIIYIKEMMATLGVPDIIDEEVMAQMAKYSEMYSERHE